GHPAGVGSPPARRPPRAGPPRGQRCRRETAPGPPRSSQYVTPPPTTRRTCGNTLAGSVARSAVLFRGRTADRPHLEPAAVLAASLGRYVGCEQAAGRPQICPPGPGPGRRAAGRLG